LPYGANSKNIVSGKKKESFQKLRHGLIFYGKPVVFGMKVLICNYGESLKSIRTWAKRWGWGRTKTHRFLKLIKNMRQIDTVSETVTTRITVLNYREYDPRNSYSETQSCQDRATSVPDAYTDKNDNKDNKEQHVEGFLLDSIEYKLANYLFKFILRRNSNHKKPNLQNWAEHINLMIRIDKRDPKKIKQIIKWCQEDTPDKQPEGQWKGWANNILSTKKLREKYDKLFVKMQESQCKQLPVITKQALQPKTYAQAKDFEQRMLAKSLLKELRNEKID
jgi:hypothetical protein